MADRPQAAPLTDAEVATSVSGEICAACGKAKAAGRPFCATDWAALPMPARWALADRAIPAERYAANFRAWLRHLQLHAERVRRVPSRGGELTFRSKDEMYAA